MINKLMFGNKLAQETQDDKKKSINLLLIKLFLKQSRVNRFIAESKISNEKKRNHIYNILFAFEKFI